MNPPVETVVNVFVKSSVDVSQAVHAHRRTGVLRHVARSLAFAKRGHQGRVIVALFLDQKSILHNVVAGVAALQADFCISVKVGVGDTHPGYPGDVALFFMSRQVRLFLNSNKINVRRGVEAINVFD